MKTFTLIDCNNFYVSCERVFNPRLRKRPVVVLSSNDGCVVARSPEVKKLKIPMAIPFFKIKHLVSKHKIIALSSNYALYADMSSRVMNIIADNSKNYEIYSIDEVFTDVTGLKNIYSHCMEIKDKVFQYTGIPVSIGIANTKTLAKTAAQIAKKNNSGLFSFADNKNTDMYLKNFPVENIWGVGIKTALYLKSRGITDALSLKRTPEYAIKSKLGVNGSRIISELNNISSYNLESQPTEVKQIRSSRTFPSAITDKNLIKQAVSEYTSRAGLKLRKKGLKAGYITVFLKSGIYSSKNHRSSITIPFEISQNNTKALINASIKGVDSIFKPLVRYKKAGVILGDLMDENKTQLAFFNEDKEKKSEKLMKAFDNINSKFGKDTLKFGACGLTGNEEWRMRCEKKSPSYTTDWNELPVVY